MKWPYQINRAGTGVIIIILILIIVIDLSFPQNNAHTEDKHKTDSGIKQN
jgi:hypothetical protein